jgi:hypothetical protein
MARPKKHHPSSSWEAEGATFPPAHDDATSTTSTRKRRRLSVAVVFVTGAAGLFALTNLKDELLTLVPGLDRQTSPVVQPAPNRGDGDRSFVLRAAWRDIGTYRTAHSLDAPPTPSEPGEPQAAETPETEPRPEESAAAIETSGDTTTAAIAIRQPPPSEAIVSAQSRVAEPEAQPGPPAETARPPSGHFWSSRALDSIALLPQFGTELVAQAEPDRTPADAETAHATSAVTSAIQSQLPGNRSSLGRPAGPKADGLPPPELPRRRPANLVPEPPKARSSVARAIRPGPAPVPAFASTPPRERTIFENFGRTMP